MKNLRKILLTTFLSLAILFAFSLSNAYSTTANAATVKMNVKNQTLIKGQTYKLRLKGSTGKVKWKSSNKSIVSVNKSGKITAKKRGSAIITATNKGKTYKCKIKVETPRISEKNIYIEIGESDYVYMYGTTLPVKWKSSNTKIATVDSDGYVTAISKGTTTLTAKINKKKYSCKVTVYDKFIRNDALQKVSHSETETPKYIITDFKNDYDQKIILSGKIIYYLNSGEIVDYENIYSIFLDQKSVKKYAFYKPYDSNSENFVHYDYYDFVLNVSSGNNYTSISDYLKIKSNRSGAHDVIVSISNTSSEPIDDMSILCIFYLNGQIVDVDNENYADWLDSGSTELFTCEAGEDISFNSYEIYLTNDCYEIY